MHSIATRQALRHASKVSGHGLAMKAFVHALALSFGLACGGAASYSQGIFQDDAARYAIQAPSLGWKPINISDNDLAWLHPNTGAIIQVNAACNPIHDIPLRALTEHLLIGFTERQELQSTLIQLDGREALKTKHLAKLDGVQVLLILSVLKKNGCVYDFNMLLPNKLEPTKSQGSFVSDKLVQNYDELIHSFHLLPAGKASL